MALLSSPPPLSEQNASIDSSKIRFEDKTDHQAMILSRRQMIKWSPIKRHQRCIEKLTRIYNSDVSKLVDISRHNIFFDSFADLTMVLPLPLIA